MTATAISTPTGGRTATIDRAHALGSLKLYYFRPVMQGYIQPFLINTLSNVPGIGFLFAGPRLAMGSLRPGSCSC